jgi:ribosomal protein L16/L10AE
MLGHVRTNKTRVGKGKPGKSRLCHVRPGKVMFVYLKTG